MRVKIELDIHGIGEIREDADSIAITLQKSDEPNGYFRLPKDFITNMEVQYLSLKKED